MKNILLIALLLLVNGLSAEGKIIEYKLVCNDKENPILSDMVNEAMQEGWEPIGNAIRGGYPNSSLTVVDNDVKFNYCQTLVKREHKVVVCPTVVPTPLMEDLAVTFNDNFVKDTKTMEQGFFEKTEVSIHVAKKGDTLTGLAKTFYGNSNLWPIIFFDNLGNYVPENSYGYMMGDKLLTPDWLPAGLRVRIRKSVDKVSKVQAVEWLEKMEKR